MTSDDSQFLDLLSHASDRVAQYATTAAEHFDLGVDRAAASIRSALDAWRATPLPPPPPPRVPGSVLLVRGPLGPVARWCERNTLAAWTLGAFIGVGGVAAGVQWWSYQGARNVGKRRARRGERGERVEVVVIGGGWSGLVRSVAVSLERRGYLVLVLVDTREDEEAVGLERREGLRAVWFEPSNADRYVEDLQRTILKVPISEYVAQGRSLSAAILIPSIPTAITSTDDLPPDTWTLTLSALQDTIATTQSLLPLLRSARARLLFLTPNAVASLHPPFHAQESTVLGGLHGFIASLRHELADQGVPVTHLRTGRVDHHTQGSAEDDLDDPRLERTPGAAAAARRNRDAFMRINRAVLQALTTRWAGGTVRVGARAWGCDVVGTLVPDRLVGLMLGAGRKGVFSWRGRSGGRRVARGLLEFGEGSWHQV